MLRDEYGNWKAWVELAGIWGSVIVASFLILGCLLLASMAFEVGHCRTLAEISTLNYQWVLWGGCLVELPNGAWVHADKAPQWMLLDMQQDGSG